MRMGIGGFTVKSMISATLTVVALTTLSGVAHPVSSELRALADAERAFAQTAREKGWRDAFLEFFSDDSVALTPKPAPAKDGIRKAPSQPFSVRELVWEPRTGDIAASGELGWLTGPSTSIDHAGDKKPRYGAYLSVWRREASGWRVLIDIGVDAPEPVTFAPGFTRTTVSDRYTGKEDKATATKTLADADRKLNERLVSEGPAKVFSDVLAPAARLHRQGMTPIVGRDAAAAWLTANWADVSNTHGAAEAAASADFGYTYGVWERKADAPKSGPYLRLWNRDSQGRWLLVVDLTHPIPR
jgi:ketosteroid isomerase-like protein